MFFTLHVGSLLPKSKYACTDVQKKRFSKKKIQLYRQTPEVVPYSVIITSHNHQSQSKHKSQQEEEFSCQVHFIIFLEKQFSFPCAKNL